MRVNATMSIPEKNSLQVLEHTQDPAFIAAKDFDEACRSLIERSRDVDLLGMELDLRGKVCAMNYLITLSSTLAIQLEVVV